MKKPSLNELMGSVAAGGEKKLSLEHLHEMLGERMPKIEFTPVGRFRLTSALRNRFGDNYRHLPGIDDIMKEFDNHADFNVKLHEMKMIKLGGK
jgi:hypothetical protein